MLNIEDLSKSNDLFDGHYKLIRPLSTDGGTADVWLAIDTNTIDSHLESDDDDSNTSSDDNYGMLVAIKIYRPKNALDIEGEQRFRDEFKIVYECRHANLVQPTSFSIFDGIPYLVLPYCKYGSSEQLINKKLSKDEIWKFILDVSSGLNRLHTNDPQIVHQDIKPANILIDNNKDYAITDFGISAKRGNYNEYNYDDSNSGTLAYMAPERFKEGAEPISQSDIWGFGATLFEILTGSVPFGEEGGKKQIEENLPVPELKNVSLDIQRLIHACLSKDYKARPTASEIRTAALNKHFPVKTYRRKFIMIAVFIVLLFGILFIGKNNLIFKKDVIPLEKKYDIAFANLSKNDCDLVSKGLEQMDSLSRIDYIPAIYQMAYTYGWYKDSISVRRKNMLGIEYFTKNDRIKFLSKSDLYNNEAVALFLRILELNDSSYPDINAKSAYRLACYYVMDNPFIRKNDEKGKQFLKISKKWAIKANDSILIRKIDVSLESFN